MKLVLLRHGESEWNLENRFTGWTDVDLSDNGRKEALSAGKALLDGGYDFDICYTSYLKRAIHTLDAVLDVMDRAWLPVIKSYKLNERHYGALQGLNKSETAEKFGEEQVLVWRRSFDVRPPVLEPSDERNPANQAQYRDEDKSELPLGESLKDTALTLQAMGPDVIVIRHPSSGAAQFLAERVSCGIVNGGDGWHAHPTQALLDSFALRQVWGDAFAGKQVLILGDIAHSRVARSNVHLLTMLGAKVRLCAPRTLLPAGVESWPVDVYGDLNQAVRDTDAVMCLRLQLERQQAGLLPDLAEYSRRFCLTERHLELTHPGVKVLHPGPMNRGLEISNDVADDPRSLVLDQVASGVATRMAVLYLLATRNDGGC